MACSLPLGCVSLTSIQIPCSNLPQMVISDIPVLQVCEIIQIEATRFYFAGAFWKWFILIGLPMRTNFICARVKSSSTCVLSHRKAITHSFHCFSPSPILFSSPLLFPSSPWAFTLFFFDSLLMFTLPQGLRTTFPSYLRVRITIFYMCLPLGCVSLTGALMHTSHVQIFHVLSTDGKQWYLCCTSVWPPKDLLPA